MLKIKKEIENTKAVLKPEGRLDTITAPEFESAISEILPTVTQLTLDFEKLEYVSSAGLRVLLSAHKAIGSSGQMKICNVSQDIMDVFEVTGFSDILNIE